MERYFPISFKLKYNQMKPWLSKYFIRLNRDYNQGGKWVHWRCSGCSCCDAVNDPACLCGHAASIPYPAQELRIWHCYSYGIDHSSSSDSCLLARNFPMPQRVAGKKKKMLWPGNEKLEHQDSIQLLQGILGMSATIQECSFVKK